MTKLMILSAYARSDLVFKALAAGARAYLSKYASREELIAGILAVAEGEVAPSRALHRGLGDEMRARAPETAPTPSLRELDVLRGIAARSSAPEIARQLHLSAGTVKTHMQHVCANLSVSDRAAAVAVAIRPGLLV